MKYSTSTHIDAANQSQLKLWSWLLLHVSLALRWATPGSTSPSWATVDRRWAACSRQVRAYSTVHLSMLS